MTGMDVMQDILDKGLPVQATVTLAQLIDEFVKQNPRYGEQDLAWGQCDAASYKFIAFAHAKGYTGELQTYTFYADALEASVFGRSENNGPNPDPEVYVVFDSQRNILKNESGIGMCTWHCIVDAGHILIDFTARQYNKNYAYPHIIAIEDRAMAAKAGA
jgi:hypothetical protein